MATPGVALKITDSELVNAITKHKGKLSYAARELNIHYVTLRKYTDDKPEIVQLIADLRNGYDVNLLDKAENVLEFAMDKMDTDINAALKSSMFVLNNKGKDRGYNPPSINQQGDIKITPSQLKEVKEMLMKEDKVESPQQD